MMTQVILRYSLAAFSALAFFALAGCSDPVPDSQRDALGPEDPNVPQGPLHRPGQPCLSCHDGNTALEFAVAGTVYVNPMDKQPMVDGVVRITDANGAFFWSPINCAGNFYILPTDFAPVYPFQVAVSYQTTYTPMESVVHRDGSCASCHIEPKGTGSAGQVFLTDVPPFPTPRVCK